MVTTEKAIAETVFNVIESEGLGPDVLAEEIPPNSHEDLRREKQCDRCGATYVAVFPQMFITTAQLRGGSRLWDMFRGNLGQCAACTEIAEREEENRRRLEEAAKAKAERGEEWERMCPTIYRKTDENLIPAKSRDARRKVLTWQYGPKGLLVPGPSGTGKTRSVWELMRRLYVDEGRSIRCFDCISFNHECNRMAMDSEHCEGWAKRIVQVDVLLFDDLGKFRLSDRVESELFAIIERRTAWERPIIATTNDNGDSLKSRMSEDRGEPLIRRLKEFCEIIAF